TTATRDACTSFISSTVRRSITPSIIPPCRRNLHGTARLTLARMISGNGAWRDHARGLSEIYEVLSKGGIKWQCA
ncbi:MAG: hypothetical protein ACN6QC_22830, partial [Paraburkholderia hospita]